MTDLRPVDLFDGLTDAELALWEEAAEERTFAPEALITEQGDPTEGIWLLLEGRTRSFLVDNGRPDPIGHHEAPTWIYAIMTLTGGEYGVRLVAETACRFAVVPRERAVALVLSQPAVHQRIMAQVAPVMNRITAIEQNRERLASLGTMAAGLAHELNNPAAAARRAASDLTEALDTISRTLDAFVSSGVEREEAHALVELQHEALARAATQSRLDALDASDAEDELLDALDDAGIADAWRIAPALAVAGVDADWLARVQAKAGPATDATLRWVAATLTANELAAELTESTDRMSRLVGAVKSYAYMDRGGVVEVDLHEGLETTVAVLGHKLKHTAIEVVRDYDRTLPKATVRGSELNQVWTNLLDNAIDALGDSGTITIRTRRDGDCAVVEVADDGPGVPADARDRVFEPFFTTKGVGAGTGLGLDAGRRIVVDRHDGSLSFDSRPGETVFRVRIPLQTRS